jgi:hypothetical protein
VSRGNTGVRCDLCGAADDAERRAEVREEHLGVEELDRRSELHQPPKVNAAWRDPNACSIVWPASV